MSALKTIARYDNPRSLGSRLRRKRARHVKRLIERSFVENGRCRILDVGGMGSYWLAFDTDWLRSRRVHVTMCNIDYSRGIQTEVDSDLFTLEIGDGCALDYPDNSFDVVHSNSVIEHVGDWFQMLKFAGETSRLAPAYYVQMPYFWFLYEPHFGMPFFHWLPEPIRVAWLLRWPCGHYPRAENVSKAVEWCQSCHLLGRTQFAALFPDTAVHREIFCGLTKSLIAIREAA